MSNIIANVVALAKDHPAAKYPWLGGQGVAPLGYSKGMALSYGRAYCKWKAGNPTVLAMARKASGDAAKDALSHYAAEYSHLGMSNTADGVATLRHLFVLVVGMGMPESSGCYCMGRDTHAQNPTSETAEAGLFQTSYNARNGHPLLVDIYNAYKADERGFVEVFKESVVCKPEYATNWGNGEGVNFQRLSKTCPAFAAEFVALAVRHKRADWHTINTKAAEVRPEWDDLLQKVEKLIDATPGADQDLM